MSCTNDHLTLGPSALQMAEDPSPDCLWITFRTPPHPGSYLGKHGRARSMGCVLRERRIVAHQGHPHCIHLLVY